MNRRNEGNDEWQGILSPRSLTVYQGWAPSLDLYLQGWTLGEGAVVYKVRSWKLGEGAVVSKDEEPECRQVIS